MIMLHGLTAFHSGGHGIFRLSFGAYSRTVEGVQDPVDGNVIMLKK